MPGIGISPLRIKTVFQANAVPAPPAAPSSLVLTVIDNARIDLAWTDNSSNEASFVIERSADGVNYTEIGSVAAGTTAYQSTGLSQATRYYYRVKAGNAGGYSDYCTAVSDWTAISMLLTPIGAATAVSTIKMRFSNTDVLATLSGTARFYSDSAGTLNASTSYTFVANGDRTRYLRVPSGNSTLLIFAKGNLTSMGTASVRFFTTNNTSGANIEGNITNITSLTILNAEFQGAINGDISNHTALTILKDNAACNIYGSINTLTQLKTLQLEGAGVITGNIQNLVAAESISCNASGLTGDFGDNAFLNALVLLYLTECKIVNYTPGRTWTNTNLNLNYATGYTPGVTMVDNMLIDMANSGTNGVEIIICAQNIARSSASDSALTTLQASSTVSIYAP